jgi:outer membrane protein OmpA-like peptidoglycan-associated protein
MRTVGCLSVLAILPLTLASAAHAQAPIPPAPAAAPAAAAPAPATAPGLAPTAASPAPAYPPPAAAPAAAPGAQPPAQPSAAPQPGAPAAQPGTQAAATVTGSATLGAPASGSADAQLGGDAAAGTAGASGEAAAEQPVNEEAWYRESREDSLTLGNSLTGAVGLLHLPTAFSGAPGTFRTSFLAGYFSGSGFLCPDRNSCVAPANVSATQDSAKSISSDIAISATFLSFLEGYVGMHSMATSNNFGRPALLQVVGDTNLGLKLFLPAKPDRIFGVAASTDLLMLNGSGKLGIDNADVTLRALAGIDLTRRSDPKQRIPLRFHTGIGYLFDGSGSLIKDVEQGRNGVRISRIERFGLDINRVDSFLLGLGGEFVHKYVQPFLEWTFDFPVNYRNPYTCSAPNNGRSPGDDCLKTASGFSSTPSRLSLGTRITPGVRGLQGMLAFDIGTGATSKFIEEVAPELPWRIFFGIAFAHDITSHGPDAGPALQVAERVVQLPPPPEYRVVGLVLDERTQQPIANAIVKFQGQALTGMVARQDGSFETANLQPGTYSFAVTADGYREGACTVTVAAAAAPAPAPAVGAAPGTTPMGPDGAGVPGSPAATAVPASAPPAAAPAGPIVTNVACPLKPVPPVGAIQGILIDGETNQSVPGGRLTIRDAKGRELSLDADGAGAFRFENVPVGSVKISIDANGYMPATVDLEIRAKAEQRPTVTLNKRPKKASVVVTANEVKITKQIHFANDSAAIATDSMGLIQEIALTLKDHPELARVEIQGHTDNTGAPAYNKRLSQERAEAVRNSLISLGIESARLTAVGYGQDKPLVPNASETLKAKNRRVQMMILEKR